MQSQTQKKHLISIAPALLEDYQSIAEIYNEYILLGNATMDETPKSVEDIAAWVNKFNERERLYVARQAQKPIGWGIIKRYSDREGYRFSCETAVYLTHAECGKGYGTTIKKYLIEQARQMNYHHMVAKIFANNKSSIDYNLRQGYTIVGTQKEVGFRNGQWLDVVIMQYLL